MKVGHNYSSQIFKKTSIQIIVCSLCICFINIALCNATALNENKLPNTFQNDIDVFEVLATPEVVTIQKGSSETIDVTVNREDDFTGQVNLTIFPSPALPAYVTAPFSPSSLPSNSSSSVLTLQVGTEAVSGTYTVKIAGTGSQGGTTRLRTVSITLIIEDAQPAGVVASFNFLENDNPINGLSNINGNITLDVQNLPDILNFGANTNGPVTGVEWTFKEQGSGSNIQAYTDNSAPYYLFPSGGWTVNTGVYELLAVQVNNTERGEVKKIVITIESAPAPTFNISVSPSSLTVTQGESKGTVVTLIPENNFSGQVDLVTEDLPSGVEGFFSITTLNTEGTSNLRFEVGESAPVGSYSVRVNALGPNQISSSTIVELNINRASTADFELSANLNSLRIIKGENGKVSFTIKPLNGFNKTVNFQAAASDNLVDFEFNPAEITEGNGTTELTIFTTEDIDLGAVEISVSAISDTVIKSVELALNIDPIPIVINPTNQFSPNGDGIDDLWVIKKIEEFSDYTVVVFDRSGKEVLKAQPYQNDWNGKNQNGKDLLPTTYFYVVRDAGGSVIKTGSVNLLR